MNKAMKVWMSILGLGLASVSSMACAIEGDEGETSAAQSDELTRAAQKQGRLDVRCSGWDASCRASVRSNLVAAKAKKVEAVLASIDKASQTRAFIAGTILPDPGPEGLCGSFEDNGALVNWCLGGGFLYIYLRFDINII